MVGVRLITDDETDLFVAGTSRPYAGATFCEARRSPTGLVIAQPACVEHGFYPWRGTPRSCSSAAGASIQRKTRSYPLRGRRQRPALRRAFFAALHHALDPHSSSPILSNEP